MHVQERGKRPLADIQREIERYVRGELNETEEDELWILFLAESEWYDYFNTYLNLMAVIKHTRSEVESSG